MKIIHLALMAGLTAGLASASPVSFIDIFNVQAFTQLSAIQPVSAQYFFATRVFLNSAGDFNAGQVTAPGGSPNGLTLSTDQLTLSYGSASFASAAAFNAAFPQGVYSYLVTSASGNPDAPASITETLPASQFATSTPYITNYTALQNLNAQSAFQVNWNTFTGAMGGLVFFDITRNSDGSTVFADDFQASAAMNAVIGANTLAPNTSYTYHLIFSNRLGGTNSSGVTDFDPVFGFDLNTSGTFTTAAASATPEPMTSLLVLAGLLGVAGLGRQRKH